MNIHDVPKFKIDCQQNTIRAVRFNPNAKYALTCGSDRTIKIWNPSKLLHLKTYKGHSDEVIDCQSNHDSCQFASCSNDRSIIIWDVENGKLIRRFRHLAPYNNIYYGSNSSTLMASSIDGTVRIYDLRAFNTWDPIQILDEAKDSVTCCKLHNNVIYTSSNDKNLRTYDLRKCKMFQDTLNYYPGHISLSKSDLLILVTSIDGPMILIEKEEPLVLCEFVNKAKEQIRMESEFLNDDCWIASGSTKGRAYIWDTLQIEPIAVLEHKMTKHPVQSLSTDTLKTVITACAGHMYLWDIN